MTKADLRATDLEAARTSFGWWLRHTSSRLPSNAALRSRRARLGDGIEDTLFALRDDRTELPPALQQLLGPLQPPTYDAAVRLLLWARHAPEGPRCLSYRAALYLVQRLDMDDADVVDVAALEAADEADDLEAASA